MITIFTVVTSSSKPSYYLFQSLEELLRPFQDLKLPYEVSENFFVVLGIVLKIVTIYVLSNA